MPLGCYLPVISAIDCELMIVENEIVYFLFCSYSLLVFTSWKRWRCPSVSNIQNSSIFQQQVLVLDDSVGNGDDFIFNQPSRKECPHRSCSLIPKFWGHLYFQNFSDFRKVIECIYYYVLCNHSRRIWSTPCNQAHNCFYSKKKCEQSLNTINSLMLIQVSFCHQNSFSINLKLRFVGFQNYRKEQWTIYTSYSLYITYVIVINFCCLCLLVLVIFESVRLVF